MNILRSFIVLIMLVCIMGMGVFQNVTKVTVRVVDEENNPIDQADVNIGFRHIRPKPPGKGWGTTVDYHPAKGKTDKNGLFSASDQTSPNVVVTVTKKDFYESAEGVPFDESGNVDEGLIEIVLKKKKNPVSMYAKYTDWIKVPVFDKLVGYDLEVGDWVAPYGKGIINDFIFTFTTKAHEISYTLSFSNDEDGIMEYKCQQDNQSSYKWPFEAPVTGYQNTLVRELKYIDRRMVTNLKKDVKYIYRVRTVTDGKDQIIKACYGKLPAEINVITKSKIRFGYYFNPHENRSLEFNEKNLFIPEGVPTDQPYQSK